MSVVKKAYNNKYLLIFLITFLSMMVVFLPHIIMGGINTAYFVDFNYQQIPFYIHVNDAIKNGVLWDWQTDLGSDIITSYSFYLMGSPFFWLVFLLPSKALFYVMFPLLALKTAVSAVTSYAFIKRFVKTENAAMIGALLYAMSSFQSFNFAFNHFHDVVALFPLLLLTLEMRVQDNKVGVFALAVAMMALVNYYFFFGQVIFLIIYFIVRCTDKSFLMTKKKFVSLAIESVLGVGIAMILLLPSALAVLANPRASSILMGRDMAFYDEGSRYLALIQNTFLLPDPMYTSNLYGDRYTRFSSMAAYLPIFSMVGVIAFMRTKREKWQTRLLWTCIVFAFIPILNASFAMFNEYYYCRWFYMPILIMSMVTAYAFDNEQVGLDKGFMITAGVFGFFIFQGLIPKKLEDSGIIVLFDNPESSVLYILQLCVTLGGFILCYYIYKYREKLKKYYRQTMLVATVLACIASTAALFYFAFFAFTGYEMNDKFYDTYFENNIIEDIPQSEEYYRIQNAGLVWNMHMLVDNAHSITTYNSTVNPSIFQFYEAIGNPRGVNSVHVPASYAVRCMKSVKYYIDSNLQFNKIGSILNQADFYGKYDGLLGLKMIDSDDNCCLYENEHFVPMGFVYDKYFDPESYEKYHPLDYSLLLMSAVYLTPEQIEKYGYTMQNFEQTSDVDYHSTMEGCFEECDKKALTACYEFEPNNRGFVARTNLEKDSLVFFSVPFDKGFKAYIDGKEVEIDNVQNGFSAVLCPAGDHSIEFKYFTPGLALGITITVVSIGLLCLYVFIWNKKFKTTDNAQSEIDY